MRTQCTCRHRLAVVRIETPAVGTHLEDKYRDGVLHRMLYSGMEDGAYSKQVQIYPERRFQRLCECPQLFGAGRLEVDTTKTAVRARHNHDPDALP